MTDRTKYSKLEDSESSVYPVSYDSPRNDELYDSLPLVRKIHHWRHVVAYTILIVLNICQLGLWLRGLYITPSSVYEDTDCIRPKLAFSAAALDGAIKYERRRLFRPLDTEFTGEARPEIDNAFARLLEPMTIRITPEEYAIANLPGESLQLLDGSGYIGELVVYHELHCIKRIRRHLNLTYYYPDLAGEDIERENVHIDHCLEYWRAAAMCRGDTTITTYFWRDRLPTSRSYSDHECVNWDLLDNWARSRMISMEDPDILNQSHRDDWIGTPDGKTRDRQHPEVVVHP